MPDLASGVTAVSWRGIDELARLVGAYCWVEQRIFTLTGAWASAPSEGAETVSEPALRVWCAAVSGHHGALAGCWAERLPLRAGVDRAALVVAPGGLLSDALDALAGKPDLGERVGALAMSLLPGLGAIYGDHLRTATPVSEAPIMEVLAHAHRVLHAEIRDGRALVEGYPQAPAGVGQVGEILERVFEGMTLFPAVHPS